MVTNNHLTVYASSSRLAVYSTNVLVVHEVIKSAENTNGLKRHAQGLILAGSKVHVIPAISQITKLQLL